MKYHHMAVYVRDMDEALKLYRDLLGFTPLWDSVVPNEQIIGQELLDAIFHTKNAKIRNVLAASPEGQKLELLQPIAPPMRRTPRENLGYPNTGIMELGLEVTDIDSWFEKIKSAGYEPLTDYVWEIPGFIRSFLFLDADGNAIQLVEETGEVPDVETSSAATA